MRPSSRMAAAKRNSRRTFPPRSGSGRRSRSRPASRSINRRRPMGNMVEGKVVVVTGAGGGIGREIALALGANGASVVVNDIGASLGGELAKDQADAAQRVVSEIEAAGGRAAANRDSVSSAESAAHIVQCAM